MNKLYCRYCGQKLSNRITEYFNQETGQPEIVTQCANLKCEVGCNNETGHSMDWLNRCQDCKADFSW